MAGDPYTEFGGSAAAADPYADFGTSEGQNTGRQKLEALRAKVATYPPAQPKKPFFERIGDQFQEAGDTLDNMSDNFARNAPKIIPQATGEAIYLAGRGYQTLMHGAPSPSDERKTANPNKPTVETMGEGLGIDVPTFKRHIANEQYLAAGVDVLPQVMGAKEVFTGATNKLASLRKSPSIPEAVTNAVNPQPKAMGMFEKTVEQHLPKAQEFAQKNKIAIEDRGSLGQSFRGAAEEAKQQYQKMTEPFQDEQVPTTYVRNYQGGHIGEGRTASIAQLESRLNTINATLKPSYEKGGATAQAAISAQDKIGLKVEAVGIRETLNNYYAKKLKVAPEAIADARQRYGSMYDISDKIQQSINNERFRQNQLAQKQVTINPFGKSDATAFVGDKVLNAIINKVRGNPADKAISKAAGR